MVACASINVASDSCTPFTKNESRICQTYKSAKKGSEKKIFTSGLFDAASDMTEGAVDEGHQHTR